MSWYASYYIGERKKDGKIYPLKNFDETGNFYPVFTRSRSFASDLYEDMAPLRQEDMSDELKKWFSSEDGADYRIINERDLGSDDYIKRGYYLIDDVKEYLNGNPDDFDGFYRKLDPITYAERFRNEQVFGAPQHEEDEFGNDVTPPPISDYMYFTYADIYSREYEVFMLRSAIDCYNNESTRGMESYNEPIDYVVLLSAG